ncbi:MAG: addiction module toxin RelE [Pyramidobacter sp.]|nr:addiction module toxin RelE [Pyramidobacter sp.]
MELRYEKQPEKYLRSLDTVTRNKLKEALEKLRRFEGDIEKIKGKQNRFRLKIYHYRVLFEWVKGSIVITVIEILPRGQAYKGGRRK